MYMANSIKMPKFYNTQKLTPNHNTWQDHKLLRLLLCIIKVHII